MKIMSYFLIVLLTVQSSILCEDKGTAQTANPVSNYIVNVKDLGALGDGTHDDTDAFQNALNKISQNNASGELFIPAGTYRITKTLTLGGPAGLQGIVIRGQGSSKFVAQTNKGAKATLLAWDGEEGGTLFQTLGIGGCQFSNMNFAGVLPDKKAAALKRGKSYTRAGILYLGGSTGAGNMINHMSMVSFFDADVGIQMARSIKEKCASDIQFSNIVFFKLGIGFNVLNDQGVDYLFNFLFACDCEKVMHFEGGGNLMVNNGQLTCCGCFLDIRGGGRCSGTFLCQNVRSEGSHRLRNKRFLLLKVEPRWEQATVYFVNFADSQWNWAKNQTETRNIPLCDIGPGASVVFQSSIFNSPVAHIHGNKGKPATLVVRESSFGYVNPLKSAFSANEYGYFKTINCRDDNCVESNPVSVLPDVVKWPSLKTINLAADSKLELDTKNIEVWTKKVQETMKDAFKGK